MLRDSLSRMRARITRIGLFACLAMLAGGGAFVACASGSEVHPMGNQSSNFPPVPGNDASTQDSTLPADDTGASYGDGQPTPTDDTSSPTTDGGSPNDDTGAPPPTCTPGQVCVDAVPGGWNGYVHIVLQAGDAGSACAAPYNAAQAQLSGQTNPDGGPLTCGACTCVLPEGGVTCSVNVGTQDLGCLGGPNAPTTPAAQGQCVSPTGLFNQPNGFVSAPTLSSGACQPQGTQPTTPPPPPTSTPVTICGVNEGGVGDAAAAGEGGAGSVTCSSLQACANLPPASDGGSISGLCIYQAGAQQCPSSGSFTVQYVVGGVEDDRTCGCDCNPPTCPTAGTVSGYSSMDCSGTASVTYNIPGKCMMGGTKPNSVIYRPTGASACSGVADSGPTGSVTIDAGSATTFCCAP
jgi:hypothetical protein